MRRLFFVLVAVAGVACGPPPPPQCCRQTTLSRNVTYTGSIPAPDGGTPTSVKVTVATGGNTTVTFVKDGREIVQGFTSTPLSP